MKTEFYVFTKSFCNNEEWTNVILYGDDRKKYEWDICGDTLLNETEYDEYERCVKDTMYSYAGDGLYYEYTRYYDYDCSDRLIHIKDSLGYEVVYEYDDYGNFVCKRGRLAHSGDDYWDIEN
jgi:YD repeat-containing protein